jgi:hypothetical protein
MVGCNGEADGVQNGPWACMRALASFYEPSSQWPVMRRRPNDIAGLHIAYSVIYTDPGKQNTPYSPLDLALPDALANLSRKLPGLPS